MGLFNKKELRRIAELEAQLAESNKEKEQLKEQIAQLSSRVEELSRLDLSREIASLQEEYDTLKERYAIARQTLADLLEDKERIQREVEVLSETKDFALGYGVYEPHFNLDDSEEYKEQIQRVRQEQKELIKLGYAAVGGESITWNGSISQGKAMVDKFKKILLRAFNGECDVMISSVDWNNIEKYEKRMDASFSSLNKLFQDQQGIIISRLYLDMKLKELQLTYEYKVKKQEEKEEQRRIREEIREQEKAEREIEAAKLKAQKEEEMYLKALEKARVDIATAQGAKQQELLNRIAELEAGLANAETLKLKAMSMAQQTKMGHVYVISNIGAFGDDVYKIGMTRRLEPMDRVRELGDASVPFPFDVHAIIFSEDAPSLEHKLHQIFEQDRLNMVNSRREFFRVPLAKIKEEAEKVGARVQFTMLAEAQEYRESERIRNEKSTNQGHNIHEGTIALEVSNYPEEI